MRFISWFTRKIEQFIADSYDPAAEELMMQDAERQEIPQSADAAPVEADANTTTEDKHTSSDTADPVQPM